MLNQKALRCSTCFFIAMAFASALHGQSDEVPWSIIQHESTASFRGLFVVDENTVWVSGSQGTVLRSTDGGRTWTSVGPTDASELDFRDVHAFDADHAIVLTAGTPARVYRTEDGGENWQIVHEDPRPEAFFDAMAFQNEKNGYAFSDPIDGRLLIITTSDGGKSWAELDRKLQPVMLSGEAGFAASGTCLCCNDGKLFIGTGGSRTETETQNARILSSSDRGNSWSVVEAPMKSGPASGIFSIAFSDPMRGVAVGGTYDQPEDNSANICITDDGGQTWTRPESTPRGYRSCVAIQSTKSGPRFVAVSRVGTDYSSDFGKTWQAWDDEVFYAVDFDSSGRLGVAVGPDGRIGTRIAEEQETDPESSELDQIFRRAIDAVGGKRAIERTQNITAIADCVGPGGDYQTTVVSFASGNTQFDQSFSYKPDQPTRIVINGSYAWNQPKSTGVPEVISPFHRLVIQLHEYQRLSFDFQNMFTGFQLVGDDTFAGIACHKVSANHHAGGEIFLYFDKEKHRLAGYALPVPGTDQLVTNAINEWTSVGRLQLPSKVTASDTAGDWVLTFHKIELNQADKSGMEVPPRVQDHVDLLALQKQAQTAHLTYNADLFVELFADNVTQLHLGEVATNSKSENLARFKQYFSAYVFKEWEDLKPPVIRISNDGTMATIIVEKRVSGTSKDEAGEDVSGQTDFAWLEVWEKIDGNWKIVTVASTRKPPGDK